MAVFSLLLNPVRKSPLKIVFYLLVLISNSYLLFFGPLSFNWEYLDLICITCQSYSFKLVLGCCFFPPHDPHKVGDLSSVIIQNIAATDQMCFSRESFGLIVTNHEHIIFDEVPRSTWYKH